MSSIFTRGNKLWVSYYDSSGRRQRRPTGLDVGQEAEARKVLKKIEDRISAQREQGVSDGNGTVAEYFESWIQKRRKLRRAADDDETRIRKHALPHLGHMALVDVRPRHIKALVAHLTTTDLAARSVRHVYGVTHTMFEDAVLDELIDNNPCVLKKGKGLPKIADKDPTWRSGAIFSREELVQLTTSDNVPEERRVLYALLFLTGCRVGEVAALRWSRYDSTTKPLGKLLVARSWDTKKQQEQPLKTEVPREVPVHPELARVLERWRTEGFARLFGRDPTTDDLLLPYKPLRGELSDPVHLRSDRVRKDLDEDCKALGLRHRRTHDTRRTLISLAREDGARMDMLQWVTHGRPGGIVNLYSEVPWKLLCEQLGCIRIKLVDEERAANDDGEQAEPVDNKPALVAVEVPAKTEKAVTVGSHPTVTARKHSSFLVEAAAIQCFAIDLNNKQERISDCLDTPGDTPVEHGPGRKTGAGQA